MRAVRLALLVGALAAALLASGDAALAQAQKPGAKPGAATPAPAAKPAEPGTGETTAAEPAEVKVEGFRSASFGMAEAQVRAAIRKDFNLANDKVTVEEHPVERTSALSITVNDLLPETGPARISYILGYKSKKLVQVNIVWTAAGNQAVKPEKLALAANTLLQYFLAEGFPRDTTVVNRRANDGSIIVFQGNDAQKRITVLRLVTQPGEGEEKDKEKPAMLLLSYVQDIQNPDVFRISKGQF